jgi:hypothetical protein
LIAILLTELVKLDIELSVLLSVELPTELALNRILEAEDVIDDTSLESFDVMEDAIDESMDDASAEMEEAPWVYGPMVAAVVCIWVRDIATRARVIDLSCTVSSEDSGFPRRVILRPC